MANARRVERMEAEHDIRHSKRINETAPHDGEAVAGRRIVEIDQELAKLQKETVDERDLAGAVASFDPVWESLSGREKFRLLRLLISRIGYNAPKGTISLNFRPSGIKGLAAEKEA